MAVMLSPGDSAPWFRAPTLGGRGDFTFDVVGGRFVVLLLLGSSAWPASQTPLETLARHKHLFDDGTATFFGVTIDPEEAQRRRLPVRVPGLRWFLDHDEAVSRLYGAVIEEEDGKRRYRPHWLLLDRTLRVIAREPSDRGEAIVAALHRAMAEEPPALPPPILVAPRILEPELCRRLIETYQRDGGQDSGFMREEDGMTVLRVYHGFKRRADCDVVDPSLRRTILARLQRLLNPPIQRAFQFEPTRVERLIVACYDEADGGGFFGAHRDNTTRGTAHRRFAVTINLNAEEYDGGDLRFPEFGPQTWRAPTGGALVFSCSLLHEVRPVTRGTRYAMLPFLYDEPAAELRERNRQYLEPGLFEAEG